MFEFQTCWTWKHLHGGLVLCKALLEVQIMVTEVEGENVKWHVTKFGFHQRPTEKHREFFLWVTPKDPIWAVIKRDLELDLDLDLRVRNECI